MWRGRRGVEERARVAQPAVSRPHVHREAGGGGGGGGGASLVGCSCSRRGRQPGGQGGGEAARHVVDVDREPMGCRHGHRPALHHHRQRRVRVAGGEGASLARGDGVGQGPEGVGGGAGVCGGAAKAQADGWDVQGASTPTIHDFQSHHQRWCARDGSRQSVRPGQQAAQGGHARRGATRGERKGSNRVTLPSHVLHPRVRGARRHTHARQAG